MEEIPRRLLREKEVLSRVGFGKFKMRELMKKGDFPSGILLDLRCRVWPSDQIDNWIEKQITDAQETQGKLAAVTLASARAAVEARRAKGTDAKRKAARAAAPAA